VRAYTAALGGNALTSFYITQLMLQDNAHKNQVINPLTNTYISRFISKRVAAVYQIFIDAHGFCLNILFQVNIIHKIIKSTDAFLGFRDLNATNIILKTFALLL
jgi:hypothetical protein